MQEKDSEGKKNQFEQSLELEMKEKDFKEKTGLNRETRFVDIMQILRCKWAMHWYCLPLPGIVSHIFLVGNK